MPKKKIEAEEVVESAESAKPVEETVETPVSSEETLVVDVHFSDEHLSRIAEAGFEPASVRNELGLAKMNKEPHLTLTEAIARAKERYGK